MAARCQISIRPSTRYPRDPLTETQRLRNLVVGLLDDAFAKRYRLTDQEREWLKALQKSFDESKITEPEAKNILERDEDRFRAIVGREVNQARH
jgi:hypothetical protein